MIELDDVWREMIARSSASGDVPAERVIDDLFALKAANDLVRERAVEWLFAVFSELAGQANRRNIAVEVERTEAHRFAAFGANMVGTRVSFVHGVRRLNIDAGWTRGPSDGFMRGGALAVAQIRHFGIARHGADLALLRANEFPRWHEIDRENVARPVEGRDLARHMAVLIDHNA